MLSHSFKSGIAATAAALLLVFTFASAQVSRPALTITGPDNAQKQVNRSSPAVKLGREVALQRSGGAQLINSNPTGIGRPTDPRRSLDVGAASGQDRFSTFAAKRPVASPATITDLGTGSGDIVETEPNDPDPEPISLPGNILGEISFNGDVDFFSFQAFAGQQITVEPFAARLPGSVLIANIGLFDNGGNLLTSSLGTQVQDPLIRFTPASDQVLIVGITDADQFGGAAFDYLLNVARGVDVDEVEPNGHRPQALGAVPTTIFGQIDAPADLDFYSFDGTAGQTLIVDVDATVFGSNLDAVVNLTDPISGAELFFNDDTDGQDPRFNILLPFTGTYVLGVGAFQSGSAGFYRMNVSLVSGAGAPVITQATHISKKLFEVSGTGFIDGATASLDGDDVRTNFISNTLVRSKAKNKVGTFVTVANPPDGRRSNPIMIQ